MDALDFVNALLFVGAGLVIAGIFSSLVANRFGAPLLLVFLVLGMLAGEDGLLGIDYDDYQSAYIVGSLALAVILFDGGLRTPLSAFRGILAPAMLLATIGVLITAAITGGAAWLIFDLTPIEGLLLGSIVGSTDAAAVFFLLRTGGLRLPSRVGSTLEIESGTNDPIAAFLVIVLTEALVAGADAPDMQLLLALAQQAAIGVGVGLVGGLLLVTVMNRIAMPGGLHPLFVVTGAVMIYGGTSLAGGSGLLAAYLAGLVMGNRPTRAFPSILGFHDAMTWLCQIVMFLLLGLLITPSTLLQYALPGLVIAVVLIFVARPAAVFLCILPFGYSQNERLFISWVGLRGAVAIFLAAIPTLAGAPEGPAYFNLAFFVVLVSLLLQGGTLNRAARRLGLALKQIRPSVRRVEIDIPGQVEQEIAGYPVASGSVILGLSRLPSWARLLMVVRKGRILGGAEAGHLAAGDYAYFLVPRERVPRLDSLFRESRDVTRRLGLVFGELPLRGDTRVGDVARFYELDFGAAEAEERLADWAARQLGGPPAIDAVIDIPKARLVVRRLESGRIASLGLQPEELRLLEPDERLLDRIEDAEASRFERWLNRLGRRRRRRA